MAVSRSSINIYLIIVLFGALIVRLWGINFGLPYNYFIDEGHMVYWAFYSGSHALRPSYYLYAPLIPMILFVEFSIYFVGGFFLGLFSNPSQFFISYLIDPAALFLIGRVTMVFIGVVTIWLVFIVGKKLFNKRVGFLAAFFLALSFLHVKESHYLKQDILMGFFVLAAFYFALNILQKRKLKDYILCGITFAFAFGAKYQAIILLPVIFLAHYLNLIQNSKLKIKNYNSKFKILKTFNFGLQLLTLHFELLTKGISKLFWFGVVFLITFSIIHPYFIIEPIKTIEQALPIAAGSRVVYPEHLAGKPVWWWYMFEHVPQGIGYPLFITAILGFAICIFRTVRELIRRSRTVRSLFLIPILPLIFFATIDFFTQMHFARYAVIVLPFFMLGAAVFVDALANFLQGVSFAKDTPFKAKIIFIFFAIILILPTFFRTIKFDYLLTRPDTRTLAKQWFEQFIPSGSKVLVQSTLRPEHPSSFNIPLSLDIKSIDSRIKDAEERNLDALYLRALKQASQGRIGYDIVATTQAGAVMDIFTGKLTRIKDVSYYTDNRIEYIVLTSWAQEKISPEFGKSFTKHYRLIKEFRPTYELMSDPHLVRVDYSVLDSVDVFRSGAIFGPVISIYQLRKE